MSEATTRPTLTLEHTAMSEAEALKFLDSIGFFIFPVPAAPITQRGKRRVRVARGQAEEGWTKRRKRGTTVASPTDDHPHSVPPDAAAPPLGTGGSSSRSWSLTGRRFPTRLHATSRPT